MMGDARSRGPTGDKKKSDDNGGPGVPDGVKQFNPKTPNAQAKPKHPQAIHYLVLGGIRMHRINEFQMYELASAIHPFVNLAGDNLLYSQVWNEWFKSRNLLNFIFSQRELAVCLPAATALYEAINEIVPLDFNAALTKTVELYTAANRKENPEAEPMLPPYNVYKIGKAASDFETILSAELQSMDTYFISPKGTHKTSVLLTQGRQELPPSVLAEVPDETKIDLDQAGRCLLFDCPTAAGFHLLRATEAVLRKYYRVVTGIEPKLKFRNWGAYIKRLEESGADSKITGFLTHIKDSFRNPTLHPETIMTDEDAQVLLGVCVSAIALLTGDIKKRAGRGALLPLAEAGAIAIPAENTESGRGQ